MSSEEAYIFKARYLYGRHGCRCDGHKREGGCALSGEVLPVAPKALPKLRGWGTHRQEVSVMRIVGGLDPAEGSNMNDVEGNQSFDGEGETE